MADLPKTRGYTWIGGAFILVSVTLYLYYVFPHKGLGVEQPIHFSHRVHAGVKEISCRFCHPFVDRSPRAGLPEMQKCFFCHDHIIPQHPEIQKERRYYQDKTPVPWVRVYYVPDHVHFNHEPHILFGLDCPQCHGDVAKWDRLQKVDFQMGFCIGCHKSLGAQVDCWLACHR